jgi:hypothetical protein
MPESKKGKEAYRPVEFDEDVYVAVGSSLFPDNRAEKSDGFHPELLQFAPMAFQDIQRALPLHYSLSFSRQLERVAELPTPASYLKGHWVAIEKWLTCPAYIN